MLILMVHPKHGARHVYSITEQEAHEALGWKVDAPALLQPKKEQELTPTERYAEKFGKPPHHRMLPESILKALEE